jgi:hypothetical protein
VQHAGGAQGTLFYIICTNAHIFNARKFRSPWLLAIYFVIRQLHFPFIFKNRPAMAVGG